VISAVQTRDRLLENTRAEQNRTRDDDNNDNNDYLYTMMTRWWLITTIIVIVHSASVLYLHTHGRFLQVNYTLVRGSTVTWVVVTRGELVFGTRMSDADMVACMRLARRRSSRPRRRVHRWYTIYHRRRRRRRRWQYIIIILSLLSS